MKAILMKTDGSSREVQPENGKEFSLKEMYALIECDMVEHLDLVKGVHLWCDEEGRLKNDPKVNFQATDYFRKAYPLEKFPHNNYPIVGNALIVDNTKKGWL